MMFPFNFFLFLVTLCCSQTAVKAVKLQPDGSCPLAVFIPFTDLRSGPFDEINTEGRSWFGYGQWSSAEALQKASFSLMATAQMAKDHFNRRDPSVVPNLANYADCNITFPDTWYLDSAYTRSTVVDTLIRLVEPSLAADDPSPICAVIGPVDPRANEGASTITEFLDIPQIAYNTVDRRLARQHDFPTFVRAIPAAIDMGKLMAAYVQDGSIMTRHFIGVLYEDSDFGEQFEGPLEDAEEDYEGYVTVTEHVALTGDDVHESIKESLEIVKEDEGYHTAVFASEHFAVLDDVAAEAQDLGLLGPDNFWFLTGEIASPELLSSMKFEVDSPIDKLLRGAAFMTNYDPFIYKPEGDPFLEAWKAQSDDLLTLLAELHPLGPDSEGYYVGEPGYFQTEVPTEHASFLFDAIVNAGMAACRAEVSGLSHVEELFLSDFEGASGRTVMQSDTNSRDISGVQFGVYNIRPGEIDPDTNTRGFTRHLTAIYDGTEQKWSKVDGEQFQYFDGTTIEPMPLRDTVDWNYLSSSVRILGFIVVGLSLFINIVSAVWVYVRRKERLVTASQPQFLYLICFGGILVALSLVFLSFDENAGWSASQLSTACSAFPWFFVIGYLIQYCAIFSKLWRLSKLMSIRRQAVNFKQVLFPFAVIIACSIIVLIAWQVIDPLVWERELLGQEDGFSEEPWISYGKCNSVKNGVIPYVVVQFFLVAVTMMMTMAISWKMRDVQSDLSEARWIFIAIFSHLQVWAIGIPVYFVLNEVSRDAVYLIDAGFTGVFANAFVTMVIWPKMFKDIRSHYFGGASSNRQPVVNLGGKGMTHISGLNSTGGSNVNDSQAQNHVFGSNALSGSGALSSSTPSGEQMRIKSLEAEVEELKASLAKFSQGTSELST